MMQVHALACRKLHKETFMCQGGCCGLSPVHTRPCENVLVSEFLEKVLNKSNFLDCYVGHRQCLSLVGFCWSGADVRVGCCSAHITEN